MITCRSEEIEGRDWNSEWEKHYFKPIVVGDRCVIHSSFHTDVPQATYDIVIDPKMAFGTGHHATTSLVIEQILDMDLSGKTVIDMGTGTGILSILAAMNGASRATGIEIDPAAHINAVENISLNGVDSKVDIILAGEYRTGRPVHSQHQQKYHHRRHPSLRFAPCDRRHHAPERILRARHTRDHGSSHTCRTVGGRTHNKRRRLDMPSPHKRLNQFQRIT